MRAERLSVACGFKTQHFTKDDNVSESTKTFSRVSVTVTEAEPSKSHSDQLLTTTNDAEGFFKS